MIVGKGMGEWESEVEGKGEVKVNGDGEEGKDMREGKGGGVVVEGEVRERECAKGRVCVSSAMLEGEGERKGMHERKDKGGKVGARERETNNRPASQIPTSQLPTREGRGKGMCGQGHR